MYKGFKFNNICGQLIPLVMMSCGMLYPDEKLQQQQHHSGRLGGWFLVKIGNGGVLLLLWSSIILSRYHKEGSFKCGWIVVSINWNI